MKTNPAKTRDWFKVFILYSKPAEGYRAFNLFLQLERRFDQEFMFENHLWQLQALGDAEAAGQAAYEASEADMIIVALDSQTLLSPAFDRCAAGLPASDTRSDHLLVCLMDEETEEARTLLHELAASKGLHFISNLEAGTYLCGSSRVGDWTRAEVGSPDPEEESLFQDGWGQFPVLRMSYAHWGINE
ncbi:MAG: hypothetical protein AB1705_23870 [Verrucomicrobiota bacterium]